MGVNFLSSFLLVEYFSNPETALSVAVYFGAILGIVGSWLLDIVVYYSRIIKEKARKLKRENDHAVAKDGEK